MSGTKIFGWLRQGMLIGTVLTSAWAGENPAGQPPARKEQEARREDYQKLPPEKREAKNKEWRKTNSGPARTEWEKRREQLKNISPEEREAKRVELRTRLEKRVTELRGKQTTATITAAELRELERREQILQRFGREKQASARAPVSTAREPAAPAPPAR